MNSILFVNELGNFLVGYRQKLKKARSELEGELVKAPQAGKACRKNADGQS